MALPVTAGLLAHYEADTLGLSNGATVTTWPDASGNGNDMATTTSTKPTYETNSLNGLGGVLVTGGQNIKDAFASANSSFTVFLVAKTPPNTGAVKYMQGFSPFMAKWSQNGRWIFGDSDFVFIEWTDDALIQQPTIFTFAHQQTGAFVRANQVLAVTGNLSTNIAGGAGVGDQLNAAGEMMTAYEYVIYDGILSGGDIDLVEDYLFTKWFVDPGFEGDGTSTLDGVTSAGSATFTPAAITGTGSSTLAGAASAGSGTLGVNGTGASTLDGVTSAGSGTFIPAAITGTGASTLDGVTSDGDGTLIAAITGTGASTLDGVTADGDGNFIAAISGTGASTLAGVTSTGTGIFAMAGEIGNVVCEVVQPLIGVCTVSMT